MNSKGSARDWRGAFVGFASVAKKVVLLNLVIAVAVVGLAFALVRRGSEPPTDSALVEQFRTRRAAFEEVARMIRDDVRLASVGERGVATTDSPFSEMRSSADIPRARYAKYLALLKDAGAMEVQRSRGPCPDICMPVWGWGWAGDTSHIWICSLCDVPTNVIGSIDDRQLAHARRERVYRHLEGQWYLCKDW
jgi:hypothetical protein